MAYLLIALGYLGAGYFFLYIIVNAEWEDWPCHRYSDYWSCWCTCGFEIHDKYHGRPSNISAVGFLLVWLPLLVVLGAKFFVEKSLALLFRPITKLKKFKVPAEPEIPKVDSPPKPTGVADYKY